MADLVITSGKDEGRRIEVIGELIIGRENVDVVIDDAELSRRHVAVRPTEGGLEVEDLGSRNGTRVDGTRISGPTRIRHGAVLSVGVTTLTVDASPVADPGETRVHQPAQATVVGKAPARPARERTQPGQGPPPRRRQAAQALSTSPSNAITQPFGSYQGNTSSRRRKAATRLWVPQVLTYAAVAGTAVGLALYFA